MREIFLRYLNRLDVEAAALADEEIIATIEASLAMQGRGATVIEPRMHLEPKSSAEGHFNVLRGFIGGEIGLAGVKVVGDFVGNYQQDLPSELGLLCLFDPQTGAPVAVLDASGITDMRTGAVTAVGAKYLAPAVSRIPVTSGHAGSPTGTCGCSTSCSASRPSGCTHAAPPAAPSSPLASPRRLANR